MVSCEIRPVLDAEGRESNRVTLALHVLPGAAARAHLAEALESPSLPSCVRPAAEWLEESEVSSPFAAEAVVTLDGPAGTPYAQATFRVQLSFLDTYPHTPPVVRFASIVYHPQVEEGGLVEGPFYDALEWARKPNRHVRRVLAVLAQMLAEPLPGGLPVPRGVRRRIEFLQQRRTRTIRAYRPLHPALFEDPPELTPEWFDARTLEACRTKDAAAIRALVREECPGVYSVPVATPAFCQAFLEEMDHFEASGLPSSRPNSMNRYGVIVNEMGLERLVDAVQQRVVCPLAEALYPDVPGCRSLDHHHAFMVTYRTGPDQDKGLDMHHDDSEVTLNLCLGKKFTGAGLTFCGVFGEKSYRKFSYKYCHSVGRAVIHLGRQRHGADDIETGERFNLIVWNKSSSLRAHALDESPTHQKEPPDVVCLSYTHDIDYEKYKPLPPGVIGKRERIERARALGGG